MPTPPPALRSARRSDLPELIALLADDPLGSTRESSTDPLPAAYERAFSCIDRDPNHELMVLVVPPQRIVGTLQLSFLPYLTYQGGLRAQIEAVRVARDHRGRGLGSELIRWAVDRARERGAHLVQLTTDKRRPTALALYQHLGFEATHEGLKLHLK